MKRAAILLAALLAACAATAWLLLLSPPAVPEPGAFDLHLAEVRRLALASPGPLPLRLNALVVADVTKPLVGALGGLRTEPFDMAWSVFQIVYPGCFLMVDSAADAELHGEGASGSFSPDRFRAAQQALRGAAAVLFTHEHPDHIGGLARSPLLSQLEPRVHLTRPQLANVAALEAAGLQEAVRSTLEPLVYQGLLRVGPGVVLIEAPGHTPGSQIVYVRLAAGREYLLVGDIAWHRAHFEEPRGHPRISAWLLGEDLPAVLGQLRALHVASRESVTVVPSHDGVYLEELVAAGRLGTGLEVPTDEPPDCPLEVAR